MSGVRLTRRESLRRAALVAAASGMPLGYTAASEVGTASWQWPDLKDITAAGYGTDPDLIHPKKNIWPKTLTEAQRALVGRLADILIPAEGESPAASRVGVVDVMDEWVSAPYPDQQAHRRVILAGLLWCDRQAELSKRRTFIELDKAEQIGIVDRIAFPQRDNPPELAEPVAFFDLYRRLVTGMFYATPEGVQELGWVGNVPIQGDYPGPSEEALAHLNAQLQRLGLD